MPQRTWACDHVVGDDSHALRNILCAADGTMSDRCLGGQQMGLCMGIWGAMSDRCLGGFWTHMSDVCQLHFMCVPDSSEISQCLLCSWVVHVLSTMSRTRHKVDCDRSKLARPHARRGSIHITTRSNTTRTHCSQFSLELFLTCFPVLQGGKGVLTHGFRSWTMGRQDAGHDGMIG